MIVSLLDALSHDLKPFDAATGERVADGYADGALKELVKAAAGSSAYFQKIMAEEADWLAAKVAGDPDAAIADLLEDLPKTPEPLGPALRIAKRRVAALIALADLGGVWDLDQVTGALSRFADGAVQAALTALVAEAVARGKLPDATGDAGVAIIGMGKLGAFELNYSSDIDLIVLFDETRYAVDDQPGIRSVLVKITQRLVKLLAEQTSEGYVFRTDLRLRPDPGVTPVCMAMGAAESYYESQGRTWERAAMIKARTIAGDLAAGAAFLDRLAPFIWRRNLDFAAIRDAEGMVNKIRHHKGLTGPITFDNHNVKLGRGGIREIEFYAQTHQLIFGGRDPSLRQARTVDTLAALAEAGRIEAETAERLTAAYREHRKLEHRIQMLDDAQTHTIPSSDEKRARLAALSGFEDVETLARDTVSRLQRVHDATALRDDTPEPIIEADATALDALDTAMDRWRSRPVLRSERAREIIADLRPLIAARISATGDPEAALHHFDAFLSAQPTGVQLFSLFEARPELLDLIVDICGTAPGLAEYLSADARVLDAVLDAGFFAPLPGQSDLRAALVADVAEAGDYEQQLDTLRRWKKEQYFRIGVQLLRGLATASDAATGYSCVAKAVVSVALDMVAKHLAVRFGPPPGRGMAVLGMGKLGSAEMTASSDLDLIVVYDPGDAEETSGPKQIPVGTYFSRATQTLISALTAPTSEGTLYEVDMRLRPSGRQGPVATRLSAFATYQRDEAWTWEHLALTRGQVLGGDPKLAADIDVAISEALTPPEDPTKVMSDVADMRRRLFTEKGAAGIWDVKSGPGRMMDVELAAQAGLRLIGTTRPARAAETLPRLAEAGFISTEDASRLAEIHQLYAAVQQVTRLIGPGFAPETRPGMAALLIGTTGFGDMDSLRLALETAYRDAAHILDRLFAKAAT